MNPNTINVAVLHADSAARASLCDFIADQVGFRIVGEAALAPQLGDLQQTSSAHVVVVHHAAGAGESVERIDSARALMPQAGLVLVLAQDAEALPQDLVASGAACLQEDRVPAELVGAVRTIAMGRRYHPA